LYAHIISSMDAECPVHLIFLDSTTLIIIHGIKIMKLFKMQFSPAPCYFLPLKYKLSLPRSQTHSNYARDQFSYPHKTAGKIIVFSNQSRYGIIMMYVCVCVSVFSNFDPVDRFWQSVVLTVRQPQRHTLGNAKMLVCFWFERDK
jgi:hypothetical protein